MTPRPTVVFSLALIWISMVSAIGCDASNGATTTKPSPGIAGNAGSGGSSGGTSGEGGTAGASGKFPWQVDPNCAANEYQVYQEYCGAKSNPKSMCLARPTHCFDSYNPVCGCDGKVYENACKANMAGVDLDAWLALAEPGLELLEGDCPPPQGYSACGAGFCDISASYCIRLDNGYVVTGYECRPLPAQCDGKASCECLVALGHSCHDEVGGGVILTDGIE